MQNISPKHLKLPNSIQVS